MPINFLEFKIKLIDERLIEKSAFFYNPISTNVSVVALKTVSNDYLL